MAAVTLFLVPDFNTSGGLLSGGLTETSPGAEVTTSPNTGWTVAKIAPTVYDFFQIAAKEPSTNFSATPLAPNGGNPNGSDALWSSVYSGTFDAGTWTLTAKVIAVSSGGDQDGVLRARIFKGSVTGTTVNSFTEISTAAVESGAITNLATTAAQTATITFSSMPATTMANEVIALMLGWKITGAGGASTRDVIFRKGTGITLVTPNFTAATVTRQPRHGFVNHSNPGVFMSRLGDGWRRRGRIFVPDLWLPERGIVAA